MPSNTSNFQDALTETSNRVSDTASNLKDKASDTASNLKDRVSDLGRSAADKIDANRRTAASGLENAASALHEKADRLPGGERVSSLAHSTAHKMKSTAHYMRSHDVRDMLGDVEEVVKNNPGPALLSAAVVGFLVGRAFSRND
jgi:ElaB/YqjD/DUF883 family membrane-anchored ribosome-binding protein